MPDTADLTAQTGHRLFPSSRRAYVAGSRPDIRVPMREIVLTPTQLPNGTEVPNEPVRVYDTSGPWGDPEFHGEASRGLPPIRAGWIRERGDVEEIPGRTARPIDDGYLSDRHREQAEAEGRRNPIKYFDRTGHPILRAKPGRRVPESRAHHWRGSLRAAARRGVPRLPRHIHGAGARRHLRFRAHGARMKKAPDRSGALFIG